MKRNGSWMLGGLVGIILVLIGGGFGHFLSDHPSYPLDVWRMDLDDVLANIGFFLAGLAAFVTVWRKTTNLEGKLNGKLERLVRDEMETAGLSQTSAETIERVESLETERNQCREELTTMRTQLRNMVGDS
jgi:hypothetical protein